MKNLPLKKFPIFYRKPNMLQLIILAFIIFILIAFQSVCYAQPTNSRLWRIDKNGIESSYIFATMHSENPSVLKLPETVKKVFIKTKSFTAEVDLSLDLTASLGLAMMLPKNKNLKSIIGDELFQSSISILSEYGIPHRVVNRMKPWAVLMTLSYPKPKTGLFLDKLLFNKAMKQNKKHYGLETVAEQIAIFNDTPLSHQTILLRDTIKQYPTFNQQLEKIRKLYLKGDLDGLQLFNQEVMSKGDYKVANKFMVNLIDKRNLKMVARMQARLLEGNAFIAVGALHLPGEKGILALLRKQHYQTTAVNN
ncbi:hypothetical protein MNBD_GAMMA22-2296 [hydrothermal vent metagenome]|uniref:TraB/GumN family protein n=1 Tax=hydrothermal vent metagenome TaxID=652676 RepID=A0A3B1A7Q1_9ZZZZ